MADKIKTLSFAVKYEIDDSFDNEKFIKMRMKVMHDSKNPNLSNFELDAIDSAKESIKNIPILANVIVDENGEMQFGGHDYAITQDEFNKEGYRIFYKETPIGLIPETNNYSVEEVDGKNYVFVDGYVWKQYSNYAEDIINRDEDIKISMEILVDEFSELQEDENYIDIKKYRYSGITLLNKNFGTGMVGANAEKIDFNFNQDKEEFIKLASELKFALEQQDTGDVDTDNEEGGENVDKYIKSFELSHDDIRSQLYKKLEEVEIQDETWYWIDLVYDTYFEYSSYSTGKYFRQNYVKTDSDVAFEGDRIEVFHMSVTAEEKAELEKMRNEFSQLKEDFNKQQEELDQLKQYKQKREDEDYQLQQKAEMEERKDFVNSFEDLDESEKKEFIDKVDQYESKDDLETEIYLFIGKKKAKVNTNTKKKDKSTFIKIQSEEESDNKGYYGKFSPQK